MAKNLISSNSATIIESGSNIYAKISETGSNANGNYIKYEDGTMIEYNTITVQDQAINTSYGSLYVGIRLITFPVEFISVPTVSCSHFRYGTGGSWGAVQSTSTTQVNLMGLDAYSRNTGTNCKIGWIAIGKWK